MPVLGFSRVLMLVCALVQTACFAQDRPPVEASRPVPDESTTASGGSAEPGDANAGPVSAASRPTCSGLGTWDAQASQFEAEVLVLVNAARAKGATCGSERKPAMPALTADAKLDCIARSYAKTMSEQDFFSHTGFDGSSPFDRMKPAYPSSRGAAENIASGQTSAQSVVAGWLESSGHCENIMGKYAVMGIGMYKDIWVQNFVLP